MGRSLLLLAVVFAVGSIAASAATPSDWRRLERPLHLPHVASGGACPLVRSALATASGQPLNGRGPAFLMSVGAAPSGVISIDQSVTDSLGWRGQKTPWFIARTYVGPLLIRGARIDGTGPIRFAKGFGQHLRELRFAAGENNGIEGRWRFLASASLFRVKGCYAFQVDGTTFSRVVTMRVA